MSSSKLYDAVRRSARVRSLGEVHCEGGEASVCRLFGFAVLLWTVQMCQMGAVTLEQKKGRWKALANTHPRLSGLKPCKFLCRNSQS